MHRARLLGRELDIGMGGVGPCEAPLGDRHLDQAAGRDQPVDDAGRAASLGGEAGSWRRIRPSSAISSARVACGRHARRMGGFVDQAHAEARLRRLKGRAGAHHHARHHAERGERVFCHPLGEAQRGNGQRRDVQPLGQGLELLWIDRLVAVAYRLVPDNADARLRAEGYEHEAARFQHSRLLARRSRRSGRARQASARERAARPPCARHCHHRAGLPTLSWPDCRLSGSLGTAGKPSAFCLVVRIHASHGSGRTSM